MNGDHRSIRSAAALGFLLIALIRCAVAGDTVIVEISGFAFSPDALEIEAGTTVLWSNLNQTHNVVQTEGPDTCTRLMGGFLSGATESDLSQQDFMHTFDTPGVYWYKCNPHCAFGMRGSITVVEPKPEGLVFSDGFEA